MTSSNELSAAKSSDWMPYDGSGMPVDGNAIVAVKFNGGSVSAGLLRASAFDWEYKDQLSDIIAYRVVKEPEAAQVLLSGSSDKIVADKAAAAGGACERTASEPAAQQGIKHSETASTVERYADGVTPETTNTESPAVAAAPTESPPQSAKGVSLSPDFVVRLKGVLHEVQAHIMFGGANLGYLNLAIDSICQTLIESESVGIRSTPSNEDVGRSADGGATQPSQIAAEGETPLTNAVEVLIKRHCRPFVSEWLPAITKLRDIERQRNSLAAELAAIKSQTKG